MKAASNRQSSDTSFGGDAWGGPGGGADHPIATGHPIRLQRGLIARSSAESDGSPEAMGDTPGAMECRHSRRARRASLRASRASAMEIALADDKCKTGNPDGERPVRQRHAAGRSYPFRFSTRARSSQNHISVGLGTALPTAEMEKLYVVPDSIGTTAGSGAMVAVCPLVTLAP